MTSETGAAMPPGPVSLSTAIFPDPGAATKTRVRMMDDQSESFVMSAWPIRGSGWVTSWSPSRRSSRSRTGSRWRWSSTRASDWSSRHDTVFWLVINQGKMVGRGHERREKDGRGSKPDPDLPYFWWNNPDKAGQFWKSTYLRNYYCNIFPIWSPHGVTNH